MNDTEEVKSPENRHQMRYVNPRRRGEGSYEAKKASDKPEKAMEDVYAEGAEKKRDSRKERACKEARIRCGEEPLDKVLKETFAGVKNLKFKARLEEYIRESESGPLPFKNEKHRAIFTEAVKQMNQEDKREMSAVYLLTAENKLWKESKGKVGKRGIQLKRIRLWKSTPEAYTLLCSAKDLTQGTKHMTLRDLGDKEVIPAKIFAIICNAMSIRKYGLGAIQYNKHETGGGR